jgi:predicted pyridoxine 5'-phosphate oxidase superfamily flavin-nucleotide-binding protein
MAYEYLRTLITPSVAQAQERLGSRTAIARMVEAVDAGGELGPAEAAYVATRDSFYLATVGETGWPYVQHRGGPAGFLRVLDGRTLAWADVRGNRQYVSTGNLAASPRASLMLMDYARQRRLKVLGTIDVVDPATDPDLLAAVTVPGWDATSAQVVQVMRLRVEAFDWNCPQHITPRWTAEELEPALEPLHDEIDRLRAENERLRALVG